MDSMGNDVDFDDQLLRALDFSAHADPDTQASEEEDDDGDHERDSQAASKRRRLESCSEAGGRQENTRQESWRGVLASLPEEILARIVGYLSAEDLNVTNQVCRYLRQFTQGDCYWQPLYWLRWGCCGDDDGMSYKLSGASSWKERYMTRDELELQEVAGCLPRIMQSYFVQMAAAKRAMACGPHLVKDPTEDRMLAQRIAAWRAARGFKTALTGKHGCCGRPNFARLAGNIYLCEQCGWAHVCGDACDARVVDSRSELPVCPISGLCFGRMMSEWEVQEFRVMHNHDCASVVIVRHSEFLLIRHSDSYMWARMGSEEKETSCRDTRQDDKGEEAAEEFGNSGRLAQAFLLGYNAANEKELQKLCFGRLDWPCK